MQVRRSADRKRYSATRRPEGMLGIPAEDLSEHSGRRLERLSAMINDRTPLLATKLFIPAPRTRRVVRDRLLQCLEAGKHRPLTLIAAPAGYGKTTLVSEWLASHSRPAAWLSLDQGENHPVLFWRHLLAAVNRIRPGFGQDVRDLLQSPGPPPAPAEAAGLIVNELAGMEGTLTLVLDDYHVILDETIHTGLVTLLESPPPALRVVMLTRSDPPLPLARMRARDQLTEVRAADLRFTPPEAMAFLRDCMDLHLEDSHVEALSARTEGWIAGLQLAALAVQGDERPQEFVDRFAGSHRFVLDYLTDEVLSRQPPDRLRFLLETSVLDRLSGPLCDALTGAEGGQSILEQLDRQNLFLIPLDDQRCWYRYHHLFRDVLRARLAPDRAAALQLRAAGWFEKQGLGAEAIAYALAAGDPDRAADLIEAGAATEMLFQGDFLTFREYLAQLPEAVMARHPWLIVNSAWASATRGDATKAGLLAEVVAGQALGRADADQLLGQAAAIHAYRAMLTGEVSRAVACAREAMPLLATDDWGVRCVMEFTLAYCSYLSGDLDDADRSYTMAEQSGRQAGHISLVVCALMAHGELLAARGRLHEAAELLRKALRWADEYRKSRSHLGAPVLIGLGEVLREQGDLAEAERRLREGLERGRGQYTPEGILHAYVSLARLQGARGDFPAVRRSLDVATAFLSDRAIGLGARLPLAACAVQYHIGQGEVARAAAWVEERLRAWGRTWPGCTSRSRSSGRGCCWRRAGLPRPGKRCPGRQPRPVRAGARGTGWRPPCWRRWRPSPPATGRPPWPCWPMLLRRLNPRAMSASSWTKDRSWSGCWRRRAAATHPGCLGPPGAWPGPRIRPGPGSSPLPNRSRIGNGRYWS